MFGTLRVARGVSSLMRISAWVTVCSLVSVVGASVHADVPDQIMFQGVLTGDDELFTGTADLSFGIYPAAEGGTELWSQSLPGVTVTSGLYAVTLGPIRSNHTINIT